MFILSALSLAGLWSCLVEPSWLDKSQLTCSLKGLPAPFHGLKILHISDLHFAKKPTMALKAAARLVKTHKPDLIVFTGDFLCYSKVQAPAALQNYLSAFTAPLGSFAVLGNHDYNSYVSFGSEGKPVVLDKSLSLLSRFKKPSPVPDDLPPSAPLITLLKNTPFTLLQNSSITLTKEGSKLNLCGLGDWYAADTRPAAAFTHWDKSAPGIVLCHNPICT
jgi:predicted MPP superfamily phosphohydrolase